MIEFIEINGRVWLGPSPWSRYVASLLLDQRLEENRKTLRYIQRPIDLLVTDMVMPQMGGIELAEQLRAMWPDIRILFISGYANLIDARDLLAFGGEFLQKPFLPSALIVKVREALDKT